MRNIVAAVNTVGLFRGAGSSNRRKYSGLSEEMFRGALYIEQRRSERSGATLILATVRLAGTDRQDEGIALNEIANALLSIVREIDVVGWSEAGSVLGILFTEIRDLDVEKQCGVLDTRIRTAIRKRVPLSIADRVLVSFSRPAATGSDSSSPRVATAARSQGRSAVVARTAKRLLDVTVSLLALILLSPAFLIVALCIKLTSDGPVIYRQERLGERGRVFTFLKFRSMFHNSDSRLHREYVSRLIENVPAQQRNQPASPTYKMVDDPRVTPVGRFLRRTSLDELPQFINVLRGNMSLVGPRPALAYEFDQYKPWHRRRVLESKPGITGLWQVEGRSRVAFDDAVRLDLQYITHWSLWLDLKILFKTPAAVFSGKGAY